MEDLEEKAMWQQLEVNHSEGKVKSRRVLRF